jgi:hypothetical protein
MKDNPNMVNAGSGFLSEPKECWIPNKMFSMMYVAGIIGMIMLSISGILDAKTSAGLFTLTIIYGLVGSLMFFKRISIVRCPSKVLLGAIAFISVTAFIDKFYI